jgi:CO/xanthine dehydrogenase Mo-binding subunit
VRVIATAVGGGFGGKCDSFIEPVVALLAQKTRRPVRLVLTREETFLCARPNPPFKITLRLGVSNEGDLLAGYARLICDSGAYTNHAPGVIGVAATFPFGAYHVPHAKVEATCVYTNKTAFGCMKGYGMPQSTFAIESMLDIIAAELKLDPLALRLRNVLQAGDRFVTGQVLPTSTAVEALIAVAEAADWPRRWRERQPHRGLGIAAQMLHIGLQSAAAFVKINMDGTVGVITSLQDIGTGAITGLAQIVADTLGVTVDDVIFSAPDSDSTPFDIGVIANRVIFDAGTAIYNAAIEVKQQLLQRAAEHLGQAPQALELTGGRVRVKVQPERAISLAHLAEQSNLAKWGPLIGKGSLMSTLAPDEVVPGYPHSPSRTHAFGAHVVEVEVDSETGQVTVLDYVACHDYGPD